MLDDPTPAERGRLATVELDEPSPFLRLGDDIIVERSTPYRPYHPHSEQQPLVPGEVYELAIEVWPTSWTFKRGHRIRLEVAPGDSPVLGAPFGHDYGVKMGADTIYHDQLRPSHLLLPLLGSGRR